jgi:hypothetical protein
MAVLQQSAAPAKFNSSLCYSIPRRVCSTAACAVYRRICSAEAGAVPRHMSVLQLSVCCPQTCLFLQGLCYSWTSVFCNILFWPDGCLCLSVLPLYVSVHHSAACTVSGVVWPTTVGAAPGLVCLKEPVLYLCLFLYKRCCAAPGSVHLHEPVLHISVRVLLCCKWRCLSTVQCMCCTCK